MIQDKVAILIKKTALVVEKLSNHMLVPYELTHTQYKILMVLFRNKGKQIRQADLEAHFSMTNPSVTGIIQNLEKKGLLERVQHPDDKRSKLLKLTEQAISIEKELYALGESIEMQITKNLTAEESKQLIVLLKKVMED